MVFVPVILQVKFKLFQIISPTGFTLSKITKVIDETNLLNILPLLTFN